MNQRPHIGLPTPDSEFFQAWGGGEPSPMPSRNRSAHARHLLDDLARLEGRWHEIDARIQRAPEASGYLAKARLAAGTPLADVLRLADKRTDTVVAARTRDGALIHYQRGDLAPLRGKIEAYADPAKDSKTTGVARNAPLVARLDDLLEPTLSDLSDGWLIPDEVNPHETYWIELWLFGGSTASDEQRRAAHQQVQWLLDTSAHASPQARWYTATEREVALVQLSGVQLILLPSSCPEVYEVRKPQHALVPHLLSAQSKGSLSMNVLPPENPDVVVSILDTGIAERHPLLQTAMAQPSASILLDDASTDDAYGHGTRMAGIVAFADLAGSLASSTDPRPRARLQNIRVMRGGTSPATDLEFWPERMQDAVTAAEVLAVPRRVFTMALGAEPDPLERRSAWAVAIDKLAYADGRGRIFCLPAGNLMPSDEAAAAYADTNLATALTTPGEALNAITVGAVTRLTAAPAGSVALAASGQLSPFSRCDAGGRRPIKPEVVAEGGNWHTASQQVQAPASSLGLLTTDRGHAIGPPLSYTNATSAACSSIAGVLAEIWRGNPTRRAATIRALLVHSARWTPTLMSQFPNKVDRLRAVGYGEVLSSRSAFSTAQRPTLVLEHEIAVDADADGRRRSHLVELPLPRAVLSSLGDHPVELSVTLAYFAEPNENLIRNYAGFGLRWKIQGPLQSDSSFARSYNRLAVATDGARGSTLDWEIGEQARQRGSVQSDRCQSTAGELAEAGKIAVFPALGWWERHPERMKPSVPYSLVVTLDAGEANVDLYAAVESQIKTSLTVDVTT